MDDPSSDEPSLRLVLEFRRSDQPWLYDDLVRFPKGTRRINRLRLLAQEGLAAEASRTTSPVAGAPVAKPAGSRRRADPGSYSITKSIFEAPDD